MRILVCNDDGIDAPGLAVLEAVANGLSDDVWVVAPDGKRTAGSGAITIARDLTMRQRSPRRFSCSGTPADCVVTAMTWVFANERRPDLVLSGINDGRNVAEDLIYSGTLGIAREASFWGVPAIGFSRVKDADRREEDVAWIAGLVSRLMAASRETVLEGHYFSVNLPTVLPAPLRQPRIGRDKIGGRAEIVGGEGDSTVLRVPRGRPHRSSAGDDNEAVDAGFVSINRLNWFGETPLSASLLRELSDEAEARRIVPGMREERV